MSTKVLLVKAMVFPVVMYGCESWTIKKAEHQRIDAFQLWCWRRILRVPWTVRRSNQSILKEFSPEYSLEGLMLKLKLQYFGHLMRRVDSLEKTLMVGGIGAGEEGDDRGWDGQMASPTQWTWVWVDSKLWEFVMDREACRAAVHGVAESRTWLKWLSSSSTSSLRYDPALPSIRGYWKNYSFDYTDHYKQSDVSGFLMYIF